MSEPWAARLAGALRVARLAAGLTQAELAARLGVHVRAVERIERGENRPACDVINAWEAVSGVELVVTPTVLTNDGGETR